MKTIYSKILIFPLTLTLGLSTVSCTESPLRQSTNPPTPVQAEAKPQAQTVSTTSVTPTPKTNQRSTFTQALDQGMSAAVMGQTALSSEDWQLVAKQWQKAIALLKEVSSSERNYKQAQSKISEYQSNLRIAQSKVAQYQRNYFQEALNSGRQAANGASSANSA
ncbi:MAG: hypothetical protein WA865_10335, partial [Spirulinaceae cyanobacterium]